MTGYAMLNGEVYQSSEARIPLMDRGFLYGDCIYEMIYAYQQKLIDAPMHLLRLRDGAQKIGLAIPWPDEQLLFEMNHLVQLAGSASSSLRLMITRGLSDGHLVPQDQGKPNRYLSCTPVTPAMQNIEAESIKLQIQQSPLQKRGEQLKTNSYLDAIAAGIGAKAEGFQDVLWINSDGELTETGSANVFLLSRDGDLVEIATPPPASGLLKGITRDRLIQLLAQAKIPVVERVITIEELPRFDEAFVCSSIRGLRAVTQIDRHRLHSCRPQATFRHIHRLYKAWLEHSSGPVPGTWQL